MLNSLVIFMLSFSIFAQNLNDQRIWKIENQKKNTYVDQGIFHSPVEIAPNKLLRVRNSYSSNKGYERVVFDFEGLVAPKIYGHISSKSKKLYIDFFKTQMLGNVSKIKNVKYLKNIDFFDIDKDLLSVELDVSSAVSYEVFYLDSPARVVVDIKK